MRQFCLFKIAYYQNEIEFQPKRWWFFLTKSQLLCSFSLTHLAKRKRSGIGCAVFILKEIWANDAFGTKKLPVIDALTFLGPFMYFLSPKYDNFAYSRLLIKLKLSFNRKDYCHYYFFFFAKSTSSCSSSLIHLAKRKWSGWSCSYNSWPNWTLWDVITRSIPKIRRKLVRERWRVYVEGYSCALTAIASIYSGVHTARVLSHLGASTSSSLTNFSIN